MVNVSVNQIHDTVTSIIRKTGSRDPFVICKSLGIHIRYFDFKGKIKGYYFYQSRIDNIALDISLPDQEAKIVLAHELGHYALHRHIAKLKGAPLGLFGGAEPMEYEANLFAADLLIEDPEEEYSLPSLFFQLKRYLILKVEGANSCAC